MIKLSLESESYIEMPLRFSNIQNNKAIINQPDSILQLKVRSKGFRLFTSKYLRNNSTFLLDIGNISLKKDDDIYRGNLVTSYLEKSIKRKLRPDVELISVSPDTIYIELVDLYVRKVPIKINMDYTLEKQYMLYDTIKIVPDSVIIQGALKQVEDVPFLETRKVELKNLNKDVDLKVELNQDSLGESIKALNDSVELFMDIEEFTEGDIELDVKMISDSTLNIRIFPDKVLVKYLVPLIDYKKIETNMFEAFVRYHPEQGNSPSKLKVQIARKPDNIRIVKIVPDKVEFIIYR